MVKKIIVTFATVVLTFVIATVVLYAQDNHTDNSENYEICSDTSFFLDSPLFTAKDETSTYRQGTVSMEEDGFSLCMENDNLALYMGGRGNAIRLVNKTTGYIWASDLLGINREEYTNAFLNVVDSSFELVYRNENGATVSVLAKDSRVSMSKSVRNNKVTVNVSLSAAKISFKYILSLTEEGINVFLPNDSIEEKGDCKITSITFFKYFGAVCKNEIPGYIVLPSGNGALIRYTEFATANTIYQVPFYGNDINYSSTETERLSLPVFGMVQGINQNACLVEIEEGSAFAKFNYYPTGLAQTNDYHLSNITFSLRETYMLSINSGDSVLVVPNDYYKSDISFDYTLISNDMANYVGLAKKYQKHLVEKGSLSKQNLSDKTSMHVDVFGREFEQGLIFKKYYNMTTTSQIRMINDELGQSGVSDIVYTLRGFYTGGYSGSGPTNVKFDGHLGKLKDLSELQYYMYYDPTETYHSSLNFPSYVVVNMQRSRGFIEEEKMTKYRFYTQIPTVLNGIRKAVNSYQDKVAFAGVSYDLYGDYNNNYTRVETFDAFETSLEGVYPMFTPNEYMLKNTSMYLNIDLYHERMKFITDSVPFLQIVLRGYMDLYSSYLNFSSNQVLDTLKCVEYGVYPAYLITYEPSHYLADTLSHNFFATEYGRVKGTMLEEYRMIATCLNQVVGAQIESRNIVEDGIVAVGYSNGKKIVVNYTGDSFTYEGHTIPGMNCGVI